MARDKVNLDLIWLKDDSLEDLDNLPATEIIATEIVEDRTASLRWPRPSLGSSSCPPRSSGCSCREAR